MSLTSNHQNAALTLKQKMLENTVFSYATSRYSDRFYVLKDIVWYGPNKIENSKEAYSEYLVVETFIYIDENPNMRLP